MKFKGFRIFLALITAFTLVACGSSESSTSAGSQADDKTAEDISDETDTAAPESEDNEYIEITADNWKDYFELKYYTKPLVTYNNPDNEKTLYGVYAGLFLKDEYVKKMDFDQAYTFDDIYQSGTAMSFQCGEFEKDKSPIWVSYSFAHSTLSFTDAGTYQVSEADVESAKAAIPYLDEQKTEIDVDAIKEMSGSSLVFSEGSSKCAQQVDADGTQMYGMLVQSELIFDGNEQTTVVYPLEVCIDDIGGYIKLK